MLFCCFRVFVMEIYPYHRKFYAIHTHVIVIIREACAVQVIEQCEEDFAKYGFGMCVLIYGMMVICCVYIDIKDRSISVLSYSYCTSVTHSKLKQKMMRRKKDVISSKLIVGFLTGALMGIIVSWVVNCALAEISLNPFFSLVRTLSLLRRRKEKKT